VHTPLLRLPVVDARGTVFSYLFMAPGGPTPVSAQTLSAALTDITIDDVVHDRSVILPGSPEVFERVDAAVPAVDVAELAEAASLHRMSVLASGVSSREQHDDYAGAGVAGTCGSPAVIATHVRRGALRTERLAAVRLVTVLSDPEYDLSLVERLVRHEPWMTLRLLELVNSSTMGAGRQVSSVRDALVILGRRALRDWAYVAATAGEGPNDRQMSLMVVVRASFCEALAPNFGVSRDEAYLLGLISGITDLFEVPVHNLLAFLPLAPVITDALRGVPGRHGELLAVARSDAFAGAPVGAAETRTLLRGYLAALRFTARRAAR